MITAKGSPVEKMAEVNNFLLQATNEECLDYSYETMIQELSEVSWDSEAGEGGRQWTYQVNVTIMCRNYELSSMVNCVGCLPPDSELSSYLQKIAK